MQVHVVLFDTNCGKALLISMPHHLLTPRMHLQDPKLLLLGTMKDPVALVRTAGTAVIMVGPPHISPPAMVTAKMWTKQN